MSDYKIVYLIVERGVEPNRQVFWRPAGNAFSCRDGSLNLKLDIHPGLVFNIRDPKSNGEKDEAELTTVGKDAVSRKQAAVVTFPNLANGQDTSSKEASARRPTVNKPVAEKPIVVPEDDFPF